MTGPFTTAYLLPQDLPTVARLETVCFSAPWSETSLATGLDRSCRVFLTAKAPDGALAGYCGMEFAAGEGYIGNVAVFPEFRRRGAARALLARLEAEARALSLDFLSLEVRMHNAAAISLYTACGYREAGRRRGFYQNPAEDALIMTLFLK